MGKERMEHQVAALEKLAKDERVQQELGKRLIREVARAVYEEKFAFVINNGKLEDRLVDITFEDTDYYIIDNGLVNGDTLVVELMQGVAPGMPAQAKRAQVTGAAEGSDS